MSTRHTPGPWRAHSGSVYTAGLKRRCVFMGGKLPSPELIANARLCAAGPDMLTTLKDIAIYCEGEPQTASQAVMATLARAAIAKAEGKAP